MVFNSLTFICFFAIVFLLHNLPFSWTIKKLNLLVASYIFYAWWSPPFVLLLMLSTVVDWFAAKGVYKATTPRSRKLWLGATLAINLGMLGYFKYGAFLLTNFAQLVRTLGIEYHPAKPDILLPIGISFYTFVTLSYTLDVYWNRMKPGDAFLDYALLVTFFPHLVAGPILRAASFLPQCLEPRRATRNQFYFGMSLFVIGLFQKVVLADYLFGPIADSVYNRPHAPVFADAWLGTLAFSGQIFCDFAGYSTCAIGVAMCLGFSLPINFRFPYAAIGFSDFWRRWHISLSTWLREYVYIPLGGNRLGPKRTYVNLLATMLLGGLWHGASWTFVAWGGLHGLYLAGERRARALIPSGTIWESPGCKLLLALATYALICFTWVFFRSSGFEQAFNICAAMCGHVSTKQVGVLTFASRLAILASIIAILALHWVMRDRPFEEVVEKMPWWSKSVALAGMLTSVLLAAQTDNHAFIYFQF